MPSSKRRPTPWLVEVECLFCKRKHDARAYDDIPRGEYGHVTCSAITQHILKTAECKRFYLRNKLIRTSSRGNEEVNLSTSIVGSTNKQPRYTQEDLNLAAPITEDDFPTRSRLNRSLNSQTLYCVGVPLERELINASLQVQEEPISPLLTTDFNDDEYSDDNIAGTGYGDDYQSDHDGDESNEEPPEQEQAGEHETGSSLSEPFRISPLPQPFPPGPQLLAEIELMNLMVQHKMPLSTFQSIFQWAIKAQKRNGFSFSDLDKPRERATVLKETRKCVRMPETKFKTVAITWEPTKKPVQLFIRTFRDSLNSLLTNTNLVNEKNFSFPHPSVPYIGKNFSQASGETQISELHHGTWWIDSWKKNCTLADVDVYDENIDHNEQGEYKEILVPIILYMDGISLDSHGRLSLTPLNMTLGIFNQEARKSPDAWETLYFQPEEAHVQIMHDYKDQTNKAPFHKMQNVHTGLDAALQSLSEEFESSDGVLWDTLPYGGKEWKVKMKFAIAYVVGDTALHNQICGSKANYNTENDGLRICRHCNCTNLDLVDPTKQSEYELYKPSHFSDLNRPKTYFDSHSQYPVENAFHKLDFGSNECGIHLATPGELLHMHQLGCAKRAVEAFEQLILGRTVETVGEQKGRGWKNLTVIAQQYGGLLSRQSDRAFPQTKFSSTFILSTTMKEGRHYAGILLCLIVTMVSTIGKYNCRQRTTIDDDYLQGQIDTMELLLGIEEFLKRGRIKVNQIQKFKKFIDLLVQEIIHNCRRKKGCGNKFIKTHLYLHLHQYIKLWGPPSGWDSSFSESHHKTQIKAPSKNTQRHASTLIKWTGIRQTELKIIGCATRAFNLETTAPYVPPSMEIKFDMFGARFRVNNNNNGDAEMEWLDSRSKGKPTYPKEVLKFICTEVLPMVEEDSLEGCTEHHRFDNIKKIIFRAHPCYRGSSGQKDAVWYDWAYFHAEEEDQPIPCQILCFLQLQTVKPNQILQNYDVCDSGLYAVVRRFKKEATSKYPGLHSNFIQKGSLDNILFLFPCESILGEVAVVPDFATRKHSGELATSPSGASFFVVRNKEYWLEWFEGKINDIDDDDEDEEGTMEEHYTDDEDHDDDDDDEESEIITDR